MTSVDFEKSLVTGAAVIAPAAFRNLMSVNIFNCCITDDAMTVLAAYPDITSVDLTDCKIITNAAAFALTATCRKPKSVNLDGCFHITNAAVIALPAYCPNSNPTSVKRRIGKADSSSKRTNGGQKPYPGPVKNKPAL